MLYEYAVMSGVGKLVRINVEYDETGLFVATSPDMPNLFVAESSEEALIHEIPQIIEALCKL